LQGGPIGALGIRALVLLPRFRDTGTRLVVVDVRVSDASSRRFNGVIQPSALSM